MRSREGDGGQMQTKPWRKGGYHVEQTSRSDLGIWIVRRQPVRRRMYRVGWSTGRRPVAVHSPRSETRA